MAGLSLMRGVPMVASSPIQYDDHSTVSSTAGALGGQQQASGGPVGGQIGELAALGGERPAAVHSPVAQQLDIHAYQPPWKSLLEYAHHQQQQQQQPRGATPPDRTLNPTSPRYQQLMGQVSEVCSEWRSLSSLLSPPLASQPARSSAQLGPLEPPLEALRGSLISRPQSGRCGGAAAATNWRPTRRSSRRPLTARVWGCHSGRPAGLLGYKKARSRAELVLLFSWRQR